MTNDQFIGILVSLLVISNPLMALPAVLGVTRNQTNAKQLQIAFLSALFGALILIVMTWFGMTILKVMGLQLEAFQAAGGSVVIILGFSMLNAKESAIKTTKEEEREQNLKSHTIVPLAFPIIAGPGAISTVVVASARFSSFTDRLLITVGAFFIAIACGIFIYFARYLEKKLGRSGVNIFGRLGGLILTTLGFQIFLTGIKTFFQLN